MENTMKTRIAILAACASTLALAQADVARANYGAASESKGPVRITDVGSEPVIVVAQSKDGGGNVDIGAFETQRQKGTTAGSGKITENESPRPQDRRSLKASRKGTDLTRGRPLIGNDGGIWR